MTDLHTLEKPPRASVVIPSADGHRGGLVPKLLESVERQRFRDFEVHLVKGVRPQGRAINQGVRATRGEVLIILDDDSCLADVFVFERLLATLDADPRIGMAGASIVVPQNATRFERRAATQFPRFNMPVVSEITDSDLACHGCCAIPRRVFDEIGGEREDIVRGLDPDLRVRLRAAGYRVVLAPEARIHHPLPGNWRALIRIFFRNGWGSAYAWKFQPATVYETHESLDSSTFNPRTSLPYRVMRFPLRLLRAACRGQGIRFVAYGAYAAGYVWGLATAKENARG